MSLTEIAQIIALIRDVAVLLLLIVLLLIPLILYRKIASLIDSVRRTVKEAEQIATTVSDKIVGPAAAGSGVAFGAGKVVSFITGMSRRKKERGGNNDGR